MVAAGEAVPIPTLPPDTTNWLVPAVRPLLGRVNAPVIVSPALLTLVEASAVAATVIAPELLVMETPVPAVKVVRV